jgi:hypothetical protein
VKTTPEGKEPKRTKGFSGGVDTIVATQKILVSLIDVERDTETSDVSETGDP